MPHASGEPQPRQSRADFIRKLGYYICGIAIGFVLLGTFQKLRKAEKAKREQEAKSVQTSPLFPPPPKDTDPLPAQSAAPSALPPGTAPHTTPASP